MTMGRDPMERRYTILAYRSGVYLLLTVVTEALCMQARHFGTQMVKWRLGTKLRNHTRA